MKKIIRLFGLLVLLFTLTFTFACEDKPADKPKEDNPIEFVDYVAAHKFNPNSGRVYQEVTVKSFIDGDTTHFLVPTSISDTGVLKARYLAINTPESTGQIEPWGKEASNFTKEKLSSAVSIIIESNDGNWNLDSTASRFLVFVWYKTSESADYRCLNLEILQEGLAIPSSISSTCYAKVCTDALNQAKALKIKVHSNEQAPGFYYGAVKVVSIKELRLNIESYLNVKVAFEGVISKIANNTAYVEEYDEEDGTSYGMQVYLSFNPVDPMVIGNRVKVVGTVQTYASEYGTTYQVSGLKHYPTRPTHEDNTLVLEENVGVTPRLIDPVSFNNDKVEVTTGTDGNEQVTQMDLSEVIIYTLIEMKNLKVQSIYTTSEATSSSKGAMTLTCKVGSETITIRTDVLYHTDKTMVVASELEGKTIDIKGIVDVFNGKPQIKVYSISDITIH